MEILKMDNVEKKQSLLKTLLNENEEQKIRFIKERDKTLAHLFLKHVIKDPNVGQIVQNWIKENFTIQKNVDSDEYSDLTILFQKEKIGTIKGTKFKKEQKNG